MTATREISRIAIVGAGQIGTAMGMALRGRPGVHEVLLHDSDRQRVQESLSSGGGDRALTSRDAVGLDTVVLAMPVPDIVGWLETHGASVGAGTLLLDTGSSKRAIVEAMARTLPPEVAAVGGHPIAGTEVPGPSGAGPGLLTDRPFVLTPFRDDPEALGRATAFVRTLGSTPVVMDAAMHDRIVARTSHLPHIVAAALVGTAEPHDQETVAALAGPGFVGATRLAAADPQVTAGFVRTNADEIRDAAEELVQLIGELVDAANTGPEALAETLRIAGLTRREILR